MLRNAMAFISIFILVLFYQNCSPPEHDIGSSSAGSTLQFGSVAESIPIFEQTLKPLLQTNCSSCHGTNQLPLFAVADSAMSHNALISFALVNMDNPAASRIVQKIQGGHSGIATGLSAQLQTAIEDWAAQLAQTGGGTGVTPVTLEAKFTSIYNLILVPKCVGCHSPTGTRRSEDYSTYTSTRNTGKVVAGNANASAMYLECLSGSMPEKAPMLSSQELAAIRDWINAGALNN